MIPSDTQIIIDNCTIKQNDYVFDNVFRGDNLIINGIDPYGAPIDVTPIRNIKIIGKGEAILDGGMYNGLSEKNQLTDGRPWDFLASRMVWPNFYNKSPHMYEDICPIGSISLENCD